MSYNHGCHLANQFRLDPKDYEVASPLVAPPWCCLVMPAGCCIASCCPLIALLSHRLIMPAGCYITSHRPLIVLPSCHLVAPAGCHIASHRPLVASPSPQLVTPACCCITSPCHLVAPSAALSSSRRAGWLLRRLSAHHPLVLMPSHRAASRCLIAPAGCCAIISCHPLIAPHSHPLIVLAGCCVACPSCAALLSSCLSPSPRPSNAAERYCCHQTPPPLPPLNTISIFPCCHSCHPLPPSNTNAHLCPSHLSNLMPAVATRHR